MISRKEFFAQFRTRGLDWSGWLTIFAERIVHSRPKKECFDFGNFSKAIISRRSSSAVFSDSFRGESAVVNFFEKVAFSGFWGVGVGRLSRFFMSQVAPSVARAS